MFWEKSPALLIGEPVLVTAEETWWGKPFHLDSEETNEPKQTWLWKSVAITENPENTITDEKNKPKPSERRLYARKVSAYLVNTERKQALFVKKAPLGQPWSSKEWLLSENGHTIHHIDHMTRTCESTETTRTRHGLLPSVLKFFVRYLSPLTLRKYFRTTDIHINLINQVRARI